MEAYIIAIRNYSKTSEKTGDYIVRILDLSDSASVHKMEAPAKKVINLIKSGDLHFINADVKNDKLVSYGRPIAKTVYNIGKSDNEYDLKDVLFVLQIIAEKIGTRSDDYNPLVVATGCDLESDINTRILGRISFTTNDKIEISKKDKTGTIYKKTYYKSPQISNYYIGETFKFDPSRSYISWYFNYNQFDTKSFGMGWFRTLDNKAPTTFMGKKSLLKVQKPIINQSKVESNRQKLELLYDCFNEKEKILADIVLSNDLYLENAYEVIEIDKQSYRLLTTDDYNNIPKNKFKLDESKYIKHLDLDSIFNRRTKVQLLKSAFITISNVLNNKYIPVNRKYFGIFESLKDRIDTKIVIFSYNDLSVVKLYRNYTTFLTKQNNKELLDKCKNKDNKERTCIMILYKEKPLYVGLSPDNNSLTFGQSEVNEYNYNMYTIINLDAPLDSLWHLIKPGDYMSRIEQDLAMINGVRVPVSLADSIINNICDCSVYLGREPRWQKTLKSIDYYLDIYTGKLFIFEVVNPYADSFRLENLDKKSTIGLLETSEVRLLDIKQLNSNNELYNLIKRLI